MSAPDASAPASVVPASVPSSAPSGAGANRTGRLALKDRAREVKAARGRPPKEGGEGQRPAGPGPDAGFSPYAVRALVRLPFAVAFAGTGYEGWMLGDGEETQLAASGSVVLNTFVRVDPRWVALTAFSVALISIASVKAIGFVAWKREQEAAAAAVKAEKETTVQG